MAKSSNYCISRHRTQAEDNVPFSCSCCVVGAAVGGAVDTLTWQGDRTCAG